MSFRFGRQDFFFQTAAAGDDRPFWLIGVSRVDEPLGSVSFGCTRFTQKIL